MAVGVLVAAPVGTCVRIGDGIAVGTLVVGTSVGDGDGRCVGTTVGIGVSPKKLLEGAGGGVGTTWIQAQKDAVEVVQKRVYQNNENVMAGTEMVQRGHGVAAKRLLDGSGTGRAH